MLDVVVIFQSPPNHKPGSYLDYVIQILSDSSLNHPNIVAMYSKRLIVWYNKSAVGIASADVRIKKAGTFSC